MIYFNTILRRIEIASYASNFRTASCQPAYLASRVLVGIFLGGGAFLAFPGFGEGGAVKREMYGLEMVKASGRLARGTVYVLLSRMEDRGYVTSRQVKVKNASGMPKRVYSITGLGQRVLTVTRQAHASMAGLAEATS